MSLIHVLLHSAQTTFAFQFNSFDTHFLTISPCALCSMNRFLPGNRESIQSLHRCSAVSFAVDGQKAHSLLGIAGFPCASGSAHRPRMTNSSVRSIASRNTHPGGRIKLPRKASIELSRRATRRFCIEHSGTVHRLPHLTRTLSSTTMDAWSRGTRCPKIGRCAAGFTDRVDRHGSGEVNRHGFSPYRICGLYNFPASTPGRS